ncbi:MAG: hypothetical protein ACR2H3_01390 [Acidimicrobiales bacterium]
MEVVTAIAAKAWWQLRPILVSNEVEAAASTEFVAWSESGGTAGSAPKEFAYLMVMHQPQGMSVRNSGYFEILDAGGVSIRSIYIPPPHTWPSLGTLATARGHPVRVDTIRKSEGPGSADWMRVNWVEPLGEGAGTLMWEVACSPALYSVEACVRITDHLTPLE